MTGLERKVGRCWWRKVSLGHYQSVCQSFIYVPVLLYLAGSDASARDDERSEGGTPLVEMGLYRSHFMKICMAAK